MTTTGPTEPQATKPFWQSTTLRGLLLLLLPKLLAKLGWQLNDTATQELADFAIEAIGAGLVAWGRYRAGGLTVPGVVVSPCLALCLLLGSGCATWDGLSPNQQQALRAAAKVALSFGVSQLGDSVKEARPYQDALLGVINATFSAATDGKAIGKALSEGVQTVLKDPALRAQVLAHLKAQLKGATASSGQPSAASRQQKFNDSIASAL